MWPPLCNTRSNVCFKLQDVDLGWVWDKASLWSKQFNNDLGEGALLQSLRKGCPSARFLDLRLVLDSVILRFSSLLSEESCSHNSSTCSCQASRMRCCFLVLWMQAARHFPNLSQHVVVCKVFNMPVAQQALRIPNSPRKATAAPCVIGSWGPRSDVRFKITIQVSLAT